MKKVTLFICTIIFLTSAFKLAAQQQGPMDAWTAYMTPGDFHKMLANDDGTWNEEVTTWMDPATPPTKSTATVVNKMILGGRYQQSTHTGTFNGMPFEGMSLVGYDNAKKVFMSSWVDNMGTGIMQMEGKWDDNTKTLNSTGTSVDPVSGKDMKVRETFKIIDNNTRTMEMFMTQDGKEFKTMEIKLTRK